MFDDLHPTERAYALSQLLQRPQPPDAVPGAFSGFGGAVVDAFPSAALTGASFFSAVLDAYGKSAAYRDAQTAAVIRGEPPPDMARLKRETIDQMGNSEDARAFREQAKRFAPDPASVGMAGQIVHGLVSSLVKAGAYTAAFGPFAPVVFGGDMGANRAQELSDQGVDAGTATASGLVTGAVSAAGLKLPPALGATRLQSAAIGAAINPVLGITERGALHALLEHANYPQIAAQYKPLDPMQLAVEALAGAAFGGLFHTAKLKKPATTAEERATPTLTPEEHAATLTMNEVRTRDADALTRPGDLIAAGKAHDAQLLARAQIDAGEPVSVAHLVDIDPPTFEQARAMATERLMTELRADLISEAANRAERGDVVQMRAELSDIQSRLEVLRSERGFKEEAKRQQESGLSRKQAESAARRELPRQVEALQAQADRLQTMLDQNRRASQAEQDLAKLDRRELPDRYLADLANRAANILRGFDESPLSKSVRTAFETQPEAMGGILLRRAARGEPRAARNAENETPEAHSNAERVPKPRETEAPLDDGAKAISDAVERLSQSPDMVIRLDDGTDVIAADAMRDADAAITQASIEAKAFRAAVACAMRFGP